MRKLKVQDRACLSPCDCNSQVLYLPLAFPQEVGGNFPRSSTVEKQWCFSHTALDGCQMEVPFTRANKDTKNLILLLLSFLTLSLGKGWGRFSLTDGCEIGFLS